MNTRFIKCVTIFSLLAAAIAVPALAAGPLTKSRILDFNKNRVKQVKTLPQKPLVNRNKDGLAVLKEAEKRKNMKIGAGGCSDFVDEVLVAAGMKPRSGLVWGVKVPLSAAKEGYILQMFDRRFEYPNGYEEFKPQHTAIIKKVEGKKLTLLHQNLFRDGATIGSPVIETTLDFASFKRGVYHIYAPVAK